MTIYRSITTKTGRFVHFNGMPIFILLVVFLFVASLCHGQSVAGMGGGQQAPTSNTYVMQEHPQHADRHAMATEQSLVGGGTMTEAHGERPLWEFGSDKVERPLGDVAREYRALALYGSEKVRIYWEQQGKKD